MRSSDLIAMGIKNLWRRKTRTLLTILGVVIGSGSIVIMLALGLGMNKAFMDEMKKMGNAQIITVTAEKNFWEEEDENDRNKRVLPLDDAAVEFFESIDGVKVAIESIPTNMELVAGRKQGYGQVVGIKLEKLAILGYELSEGRLPTVEDKNGIVVGANVPKNFHDWRQRRRRGEEPEPLDMMNTKIFGYINGTYDKNGNKKRGIRITTVGVLTEAFDYTRDYTIFMDMDTVKRLVKEDKMKNGQNNNYGRGGNVKDGNYTEIKVVCDDIFQVERVQDIIKEKGYFTSSNFDWVKNEKKQSEIIQMVLGGIGVVSFFIAAIGITNTMVMAIYERTREIGVMKVLGAEVPDILRLFLLEALIIGFLGGVIGLAVSMGGSTLIDKFAGDLNLMSGRMSYGQDPQEAVTKITLIPVWLMGSSVIFSTLVGGIAGFFPAIRATKLSALEAIKNE